jgi:uncharacterized membrane protein YphA (DoxX/SURF4 family)
MRRSPLKSNTLKIGLATAVMLVILRLSLGCHFLYEGAWKIHHANTFSARPFLTQAKGPLAPVFYALVPDLYGKQRLAIVEDDKGKKKITGECYLTVWKDLQERAVDYYQLDKEQTARAQELYSDYAKGLKEYLADHFDDIRAYFDSLKRFEATEAAGNRGAKFQQKRLWDQQQKLRGEVHAWLADLDKMGQDYQLALWKILDEDQQARGPLSMQAVGPEKLPLPLPFVKGRSDLINKAVTYGLTAIGVCLVVGLFTRLAALGGGLFMISVLLSQLPLPWIYPPPSPIEGHALLVDKNFIEMVSLFLLATTAAGRWAGLDFFVHRWLVRPFCSRKDNED